MAAMAILRFVNFFRPIKVRSLDSFIVYMKHLGCNSVSGDVSVKTGDRGRRVDIHLSSRASNGRNVVWERTGAWVNYEENDENTVNAACGRSLSMLSRDIERIRRELPGVTTVITDWKGGHWTRQSANSG